MSNLSKLGGREGRSQMHTCREGSILKRVVEAGEAAKQLVSKLACFTE